MKKGTIFIGPPGSGKTRRANNLAYEITGDRKKVLTIYDNMAEILTYFERAKRFLSQGTFYILDDIVKWPDIKLLTDPNNRRLHPENIILCSQSEPPAEYNEFFNIIKLTR